MSLFYCLDPPSDVRNQSAMLPEANFSQDSGNSSDSEADDQATVLPPSSKTTHDHEQLQLFCPTILHGEPLTDRKSTFQAHVAEVETGDEVWTQ